MARRRGVTPEELRLHEARERSAHWRRWGPYLAEREWGTVREDYSPNGAAWESLPHDHARSRAYRWGEDGIGGISDNHGRLCFALALWNGRDAILKERLFGLTGAEGNHGEDVKEYYFYLDSTPTHAYMKFLYKYPQAEFPYATLVEENRRRGRGAREYELLYTENDTNAERLWGRPNASPYVKDGIGRYVVEGRTDAVNPGRVGTKAAAYHRLTLGAGASASARFRLTNTPIPRDAFGREF